MLPNYWMNPETNSINRLGMLHIEHYETLSLDGTWRFQLLNFRASFSEFCKAFLFGISIC